MIDRQNRHVQRVHGICRIDGLAIHNAVHAAVENHAANIRNSRQFRRLDIVGMNFAVYAQRANFAGDFRVFFAAQVEYQNDVLLHGVSSSL